MVALPGQLFTNTQIPACIWLLTKTKEAKNGKDDRKGKVLFIDAREKGYMKDRVLRDFTIADVKEIADTFHKWQKNEDYEDIQGFCKSTTLAEIAKNDFVVTPGRYVGTTEKEEDSEPYTEKMNRLTSSLKTYLDEGTILETEIKKQLGGLGYEVE
jgi:type I restriction enzyme M protein